MNRKSVVQNLYLVLGSLFFAAILAEILLRVMLPPPIVWKYPQERYSFDSETGHRLQANQQSFTHDKKVFVNSQGIRDAEYSHEPAGQVLRIMSLGDSQTFGNGVAVEDTWPKQLERELNLQAGSHDFEVLNGGLPATDTWQHEILLQRYMSIYNPDVVVLAFYVNDVVNMPASIVNTFEDAPGSLGLRLVYLLKRSALLLSLRNGYDAVNQLLSPRREFALQRALLAGESNSVIDSRWGQVERSLANMNAVTARNDAGFLVVSLPRRDQVDGSMPADRYNQRLSAIVDRVGARFLNVLEPLQRAYEEHGKALFIPWDGHNTAIANRIIAGEIAAVIPGLAAGGVE